MSGKNFWRLEDPVLDKNGNVVKGGMWKHQRRVWESKAYIKALVGGYGSGKSITAIKRGISLSLANAPIPIMIVSPNHEQARKTIVTDMQSILDGRRITYEYKAQAKEFKIYYKGLESTIWIASGDRPDSLKGPNLAAAIIDEPFIQDKSVFDQMMARVRHPDATHREILLTGTPEEMNWGYDVLLGDDADKYDSELINASTLDNKALPKEFIDSLLNSMDSKTKAAYLNGEFIDLSTSKIYYGFSRSKNVKAFEYEEYKELQIGMDFNVNPMSACIFYIEDNIMYVVDEVTIDNSNTEQIASKIKDLIKRYNPDQLINKIKVYPDPTGRARKTSAPIGVTDHTILRDNGYVVLSSPGVVAIKDSTNSVNKKLEDGEVIIHPRCKSLIKDFERLTHDKSKQQLEKLGLTHMSDAFKYACYYIYPLNRAPSRGQVWIK